MFMFFLLSACSTRARPGGRHRGRHQRRREKPASGAAAGTTLLLRLCIQEKRRGICSKTSSAGGGASGLRPRRRRGRICSLFCLDCWTRQHFGHVPHDCQALPPSVFLPTSRERKTLCDSCFTAPVLADDCYPGKCLGLFSSFVRLTTPPPQTRPFLPDLFHLQVSPP